MPVVVVFHERHALAFYRMRNDGRWLSTAVRQSRQHINQRLEVMTIDLARAPSEREPFVD